MAENVQITPGVGVTIGADNVLDGTLGNAQIQYVKIMDGTIGGTNKVAVTADGLAVDGSAVTQPISAVSLPLPTGAATETTLASIQTNSTNLDVALSTRASEATLSSIDAQTIQLSFSGGRLLVDASGTIQPISGTITALQGTSPWVVGGTVTVGNASLAVTQSGVWSVGRTWTLASGTDSISSVQSGTWITDRNWTLASGTDSVAATQSGTWNINNVSGTVSLPTGAATAANQVTANASLSSIDGKTPPLGQAAMAASVPVVIASNQSAVPVTLTSTTITGTVAVTQSTSPWVVSGTVTSNIGTTNGLALDATVAALEVTQGSTTSGQKGILELGAVTTAAPAYTTGQTSPLSLDTAGNLRVVLSGSSIDIGVVDQGTQGTIAQSWFVELTDGSNVLGTSTHPVRIDPTGTTTQPVSVTNASLSVTQGTSPWVVSGTVTANAGTGNFTVVQPTGTNLHTVIDSGSITVSNVTLAVTQSGVWTTGRTWTLASGTDSISSVQSGTWNLNNISGTISLPTGASTSALQTSGNASLTSIDGKTPALGQATMAASTPVVIASNQSTIPVSLTSTTITGTVAVTGPLTDTQLRATPVPVSGTVTANAGTGTFNIQANASTNLNQVGGSAVTLGQKTMANSVPVVLASDQSALPISGTITANPAIATTGTSANIARSNANQTLIASNSLRKGATVYNDSGSVLYVKLGATASTTSFTTQVASQAYFEVPFNYTGIIDGIWGSNGAGAARVTELS